MQLVRAAHECLKSTRAAAGQKWRARDGGILGLASQSLSVSMCGTYTVPTIQMVLRCPEVRRGNLDAPRRTHVVSGTPARPVAHPPMADALSTFASLLLPGPSTGSQGGSRAR